MTAGSTPSVIEGQWQHGLRAVVEGRVAPRIVLQPIVDLQRGTVVGHEALARFPGPPSAGPDEWFEAAARAGVGPALTCAVVVRALALLPELPADTFLSINLEPHHVTDADVQRAFLAAGRLDRVVVELTEHAAIIDTAGVLAGLDSLRAAGARTAIDDAGSGYAGLQALLQLRPDIVKLDRSLVHGLDVDPARRVLLRALGAVADGIDAWVLGEGVETVGELGELVAAGVPLGQGYLLGRPSDGFTPEIPLDVAKALLERLSQRRQDHVLAGLVERSVERLGDVVLFDSGVAVEVDSLSRPVALRLAGRDRETRLLIAKAADLIADAARRAVARHGGVWSDPIIVTDGRGTLAGVVLVSRLLEHFADRARPVSPWAG